jgi:hypothetical protein
MLESDMQSAQGSNPVEAASSSSVRATVSTRIPRVPGERVSKARVGDFYGTLLHPKSLRAKAGQTFESRHICHSHRSTFWRQNYLTTNRERSAANGFAFQSDTRVPVRRLR